MVGRAGALHPYALRDFGVFVQAEVEIPPVGGSEGVAAGHVGRPCGARSQRHWQVSYLTARERDVLESIWDGGGDEAVAAVRHEPIEGRPGRVIGQFLDRGVEDAERLPGAGDEQRIQTPAAEQHAGYTLFRAEGDLSTAGHGDAVADIELGVAAVEIGVVGIHEAAHEVAVVDRDVGVSVLALHAGLEEGRAEIVEGVRPGVVGRQIQADAHEIADADAVVNATVL